jgi:pimeloyl-ACP methyl ester carboxylesterase
MIMKKYTPFYGQSSNRIPFVKFGNGSKTMLLFYGGPGNILPQGFTFEAQAKDYFPLCEDYTIYLLMRKIGLSSGDTTETMARDYADMIIQDFHGHVEAIIGYSYGGLIAQHFAADYPNLCQKIIIQSATNENTERGKQIDEKFAQYLIKRKKGHAFAISLEVIMEPGLKLKMMQCFMKCIGPFIPLPHYPEFASDVKIELEAELTHDASKKFAKISFPILIILGDKDYYFSIESAEWMLDQINEAKFLKLHNCGHQSSKHEYFIPNVKKYLEL